MKDTLLDTLHKTLADNPKGIKEYDLLLKLGKMDLPVFAKVDFADSLDLFRAHFMLFHLLYCLRDRLHQEEKGHLEIDCLNIVLHPWQRGDQFLPGRHDNLRDYYLDMAKMESMSASDLDEMIERFWKEYFKFHQKPESLRILGLDQGASRREVKRRFRKLALAHHPDRGGDPEMFHRVSEAARTLLSCSFGETPEDREE